MLCLVSILVVPRVAEPFADAIVARRATIASANGSATRGTTKMETKQSIEATCPECRGPLSEIDYGTVREFRCLVGHCYSPHTVLRAHLATEESTLWAAV